MKKNQKPVNQFTSEQENTEFKKALAENVQEQFELLHSLETQKIKALTKNEVNSLPKIKILFKDLTDKWRYDNRQEANDIQRLKISAHKRSNNDDCWGISSCSNI